MNSRGVCAGVDGFDTLKPGPDDRIECIHSKSAITKLCKALMRGKKRFAGDLSGRFQEGKFVCAVDKHCRD